MPKEKKTNDIKGELIMAKKPVSMEPEILRAFEKANFEIPVEDEQEGEQEVPTAGLTIREMNIARDNFSAFKMACSMRLVRAIQINEKCVCGIEDVEIDNFKHEEGHCVLTLCWTDEKFNRRETYFSEGAFYNASFERDGIVIMNTEGEKLQLNLLIEYPISRP